MMKIYHRPCVIVFSYHTMQCQTSPNYYLCLSRHKIKSILILKKFGGEAVCFKALVISQVLVHLMNVIVDIFSLIFRRCLSGIIVLISCNRTAGAQFKIT